MRGLAPRSMLVAAALLGAALALPAAAQARWSRPFALDPPGTLDVQASQLAISSSGSAAAAFGLQDVDTPGSAQGYLTLRSARGTVASPVAVPGSSQLLALAYDRRSLELLSGASSPTRICCSSVRAVEVSPGGRLGRPRTLVSGLAGDTTGQLLALADGQLLAAVATERGVWVVQATRGNRFARPHRLTGAGQMPESLAAAWLGRERTIVAWTAGRGVAGAVDPSSVHYALGSRAAAPRTARTAVRVADGHRIDELGLAPRAGGATVAWIESWYDRRGVYHSRVRASDIGPGAQARTVSPAGRLASGLTFDGDAAGAQALAWESCTSGDACTAQVASRRAHGSLGRARTLGAIDPSQTPALSVGPDGQVVVGWVRRGHPLAVIAVGAGRRFGAPRTLSSTSYAYDMTVTAGRRHQALAAWTQGTLNPSVVGAAFTR